MKNKHPAGTDRITLNGNRKQENPVGTSVYLMGMIQNGRPVLRKKIVKGRLTDPLSKERPFVD